MLIEADSSVTIETFPSSEQIENSIKLEDSGISEPFSEGQLCSSSKWQSDIQQEGTLGENVKHAFAVYSGVIPRDSFGLLKAKEGVGMQDDLISTLLKPLESDLDESLDIAMELDISLSESFDVNEVLSATEKLSNMIDDSELKPVYPVFELSHEDSKDEQDFGSKLKSKEVPCFHSSTPISKPQCFRNSFKPLPEQRKKRPRRACMKTSPYIDTVDIGTLSAAGGLADHSYSKIAKEVKFTLKTCRKLTTVKKMSSHRNKVADGIHTTVIGNSDDNDVQNKVPLALALLNS